MHLVTTKPPVALQVSNDLPAAAEKVPFGRRVDFTFQLVDRDGEPVYEEDVEITVRSVETLDGKVTSRRTLTYDTDASGRVELTFPLGRFRPAGDEEGLLVLTVDDSSGYNVIDVNGTPIPNDTVQLTWSDEDEAPSTLLLEQSVRYHEATTTSRGTNAVTATLVDQYGNPVRGVKIHFVSEGQHGLGRDPQDSTMAKSNHRPTTNRRGQATVRYRWNHGEPGTEEISAFTEGIDPQVVTDPTDPLRHYWVDNAPTDRVLTSYTVLVHDLKRDTLVVGSGDGPFVVVYDRSDWFLLGSDRVGYTSFKEAVEEGDRVTLDLDSHDPDDRNEFTRIE